jgi:hypothetical protein
MFIFSKSIYNSIIDYSYIASFSIPPSLPLSLYNSHVTLALSISLDLLTLPTLRHSRYSVYGDNIEWIGTKAFRRCISLKKVEFKEVKRICEKAFLDCMLIGPVLRLINLQRVDESAFENCRGIEHIQIVDSFELDIARKSFRLCTGLKRIHLPSSNTFVCESAFGTSSFQYSHQNESQYTHTYTYTHKLQKIV